MQSFYLARQPIYDRDLRVAGYELLFRGGPDDQANITDPDRATSEVITSSVIDIGLENLVGSHTAFINATAAVLHGALPLPELKGQIVLEVLEDITVDQALLQRLDVLSRSGYKLALDDFVYRPGCEPLLAIADYVKLDVMALDPETLADHVARIRPHDVILVAEKVETYEDLARCRTLDFDLYQGYFFCRPQMITGRRPAANRLAVIQLIARLQNPDASIAELDALVTSDPALSYRLLKYINSAYCGMRTTVTSIHQALVMVGTEMVKGWATLMLMSELSEDKPPELITTALIRARMCELAARSAGGADSHQCFTVGLLSVLDALLDLPMDQVVEGLPFEEETRAALCGGDGPLGELLRRVIAYEQAKLSEEANLEGLAANYLESVSWAMEMQQALAA